MKKTHSHVGTMLCNKISVGFLPQCGQIVFIAKHPILLLRAIRKHFDDANNKKEKKQTRIVSSCRVK